MQHQAVIFDLDGTLLDTLADIAHAANATLNQHGLPPYPIAAYRDFIGDGVEMLFQRALPQQSADMETLRRCCDGFREAYATMWNVHTRLFAGMDRLLDELSARALRLAVLSNKPHQFTQLCAQEFLAAWDFAAVYGQRPDIPRKPDPAGAMAIADELSLPADHCVFLGDSNVDMRTARNAGMLAIGAAWGFRTRGELQSTGAAHVIEHPTQLLELLC